MGTCRQCRRGSYNLCPDVVFFATPPVDGSISRYVPIAADFAHPVPAGVTAEQAAMAEPVSVGVFRYAHTYPFALQLIRVGAVDVDAVITHRFALGDTADALSVGRTDPEALKAMVLGPQTTGSAS